MFGTFTISMCATVTYPGVGMEQVNTHILYCGFTEVPHLSQNFHFSSVITAIKNIKVTTWTYVGLKYCDRHHISYNIKTQIA